MTDEYDIIKKLEETIKEYEKTIELRDQQINDLNKTILRLQDYIIGEWESS